jgi:hypothetical protein
MHNPPARNLPVSLVPAPGNGLKKALNGQISTLNRPDRPVNWHTATRPEADIYQ